MEPLLDDHDHDLIRQLALSVKRRQAGQGTGEMRSPALGGGIEFADYREYVPGDDVRQVDWAVFLRFRRLLVKLCAEEKELTLLVLVDTSRSMAFGQPSKFRLAQRLAAVLAGVALATGNRAGVLSWGSELREMVAPTRGLRALSSLAQRVERLEPDSEGRPMACARQFATRYGRRCLAVLVTDLLHPDWEAAVPGLAASGCEAHVLQVLSPEELEPTLQGEVTLVDLETGGEVSLHVDAAALDRYATELERWLDQVGSLCRRSGLGYALVDSRVSVARLLQDDLRRSGLLC